jgi:hypothetical protein
MPHGVTNPIMGRQAKRAAMIQAGASVRYFEPIDKQKDWSMVGGTTALPDSLYTAVLVMPIVGVGDGPVSDTVTLKEPSALGKAIGLPKHDPESAVHAICLKNCDEDEGGCTYEGGVNSVVACCCLSTAVVVPWVAAFVVSCLLQIAFVYFIAVSPTAQADPLGCPATHSLLRLAGVVTLTAYCLAEMYETASMFWWLVLLPTTETTEVLQLLHDPESGEPVGYASGVSKWYKRTATLCVVLPKLAIGAALWWYGSTYVARSADDDELILNTVAVLFVLEIDDQLAKVAIPQRFAQLLAQLPPIALSDPTDGEADGFAAYCVVMKQFFGQWLNFGVIAGMTAAVLLTACAKADLAINATDVSGSGAGGAA